MKILFCDYEYPPLGGGGGVINALVAEELAKSHEVTVLTSQPAGYPNDVVENGVRVVRVPVFVRRQRSAANLFSMLAYIAMGLRTGRQLVEEQRFDIINTYFVLPTGPVGNRLSKWVNVPNVLSVLGGDIYDPSKLTSPHRHYFLRAVVRRLLRSADSVVGESRNILEYMRRFYTPEIEGNLIPLGIRPPPAEVAQRAEFGFTTDDVLLVTVGRLVARKATEQLVDMTAELGDNNVHLLIVGSGPQEKTLRELSNRRGVKHRVHFMGQVSDVEKYRILHMCDVFVSTSQHEGFGLVFLEAMASGLPVLCYDQGGQTDFLEHGKSGYITGLNDQRTLRRWCRELIDNASLRKAMQEYNRERVEEFYISRCAERYETLFKNVIAQYKEVRNNGLVELS